MYPAEKACSGLASKKIGHVKKLTLDMLKKEQPIEFILDSNGNAMEMHSKRISFNIEEVKKEIVETARQIINCYKKGFSRCLTDKNCEFCDEYL